MPDNGLQGMIQLITALGDLQVRKRQLVDQEQQMAQQRDQFTQQLGIQKDDQIYKVFTKLLDTYTNSSTASRGTLKQMGEILGLHPQLIDALATYGQNAPETIQTLQNRAATAGYNQANPQQLAQMNAGAASQATTGLNVGQAASANTVASALGNGQASFTPQMVGAYQQGLASQATSQQNPLAFATGQQILQNPPLLSALAKIQSGQALTAAESAQIANAQRGQDLTAQTTMYGHNVQMLGQAGQVAADMARTSEVGRATPEQKRQALDNAAAMITQMQKDKDATSHNMHMAQYNVLIHTFFPEYGDALLIKGKDDVPGKAGLLDIVRSAVQSPSPQNIPPAFDFRQFMQQVPQFTPPQP